MKNKTKCLTALLPFDLTGYSEKDKTRYKLESVNIYDKPSWHKIPDFEFQLCPSTVDHTIKPLVRPMCDLMIPITVDGKTFTPIKEMFRAIDPTDYIDFEYFTNKEIDLLMDTCQLQIDDNWNHVLSIKSIDNPINELSFCVSTNRVELFFDNEEFSFCISHQKKLFEMMRSWHLDLDGMIESGDAYNINLIK